MRPQLPRLAIPRHLSSLQAGRAVAALLVVLFHASRSIFENNRYWGVAPFGGVFDFGNSGVVFFFVMSGFIIYHAHEWDLSHPERVQAYIWKRFRRIYPIYWVTMLLVLPVYYVVHSFGYGFETQPVVLLSSFTLIHVQSQDAVLRVSWTLFHEALFYALFAAAIWRARVGFLMLAIWFAASTWALDPTYDARLTGFYFSYLHWLFAIGLLARWLLGKIAIPLPRVVVVFALLLVALLAMDQDYEGVLSEPARTLAFGLACSLALLGLVELERQARLSTPRWLILLGDASYSIYLVHFFTLSFLAKLAWFSGVAKLIPPDTAYLALAAAAVGSGLAFHLWVERPLLFRLGRPPLARQVRLA